MRAEIIAIGSEILLGQSIDTNGPWIANELSHIGIDCHFKTVVGDNLNNMVSTMKLALSRADIILCTGGLGPTQDDITRDALAEVLGVPLIFDEALAKRIEAKFRQRHRTMSQNNLRQAYYPKGTTVLKTHPGTAPGIHAQYGDKHLFLMPGVPTEMMAMMQDSILPYLRTLLPDIAEIYTRTLRCWGLPESDIAEKLAPINDELDEKDNPKLSFLASGIEGIQVRFSSKNHSKEEADQVIAPYFRRAESILGPIVFGYDNESMESAIATLLNERGLTLSLYESFSNGFITTRLNERSNSETYLKGSLVESNHIAVDIKEKLHQVLSYFHSDIALSVTGREVDDQNFEMTLYLLHHQTMIEEKLVLPYFNHQQVVQFSVINLLNLLRRYLIGNVNSAD